jgi:hypothetical protein
MSNPIHHLSPWSRRPARLPDVPEAIGATDAELVRLTGDPIARECARWDIWRLLYGPRLA